MNSQLALHLARIRHADLRRGAVERRWARRPERPEAGPVAALFAAMFAAQAGLLSLGPVLPDVAHEFGVSTAAAGQLRTLGGLAGGVTAVVVAVFGSRLGLRGMLIAGQLMLALGTLASAAAPNLGMLAAGQAAVGAAAGLLIAGALAASAAWIESGRRAHALAAASLGQPMAWVAGMPLGGLLAEIDWRYSLVGIPLAASLAGTATLARVARPAHSTPAGRPLRSLPAWAGPELASYAAWGGVLVFAGALLAESYSVSPGVVGLLLGAVALAALPGNMLARPWLAGYARELLVALGLAAALLTAVFGMVRPGAAASTTILALLVLVACTRTIAGSALALQSAGDRRLATMGVRAATGQFGYLVGAAVGGAALAAGGYKMLGFSLATLFVLGTIPHLTAVVPEARKRRLKNGFDVRLREAASSSAS
jgi:MFS transporter, DHA1 family, inner membrane transport protein